MNYRSVKDRIAVDISSLRLEIGEEKALTTLNSLGFKSIEVDLIAIARQCMSTSKYRRGARPHEAPAVMDCSSFTKWLYGQRGIWLPRRSIQQRELGKLIEACELKAGDLVFVKGAFDWYHHDPADGVGHVGIATDERTVIHACDSEVHVIETPYERFVGKLKYRGIRRYIENDPQVLTLEIPATKDVETSDDLRWLILQSLPRE